MKTRLSVFFASLLLIVVFCQAPASALEFGARVNYWIPTFDSKLKVDKDGVAGTEINLKDDLDVKNDNIPFVEAFLGVGNHELTFMYAYINCKGDKTINRDIVFNGELFHVNALVESRLKANVFDLEYQYKLLNFKNILAGLSAGLLLRVKYIDGEAKLYSATAGSTYDEKETLRVPVPMVGAALKVGILANILEARAKGVGMMYSGSYFYDAMADLAVTPFPFVDIHGGYRAMSLKIDNVSDIYATLTFHGPYVGIKVGF